MVPITFSGNGKTSGFWPAWLTGVRAAGRFHCFQLVRAFRWRGRLISIRKPKSLSPPPKWYWFNFQFNSISLLHINSGLDFPICRGGTGASGQTFFNGIQNQFFQLTENVFQKFNFMRKYLFSSTRRPSRATVFTSFPKSLSLSLAVSLLGDTHVCTRTWMDIRRNVRFPELVFVTRNEMPRDWLPSSNFTSSSFFWCPGSNGWRPMTNFHDRIEWLCHFLFRGFSYSASTQQGQWVANPVRGLPKHIKRRRGLKLRFKEGRRRPEGLADVMRVWMQLGRLCSLSCLLLWIRSQALYLSYWLTHSRLLIPERGGQIYPLAVD